VILFNLSGHGHFDLAAYNEYLSGNIQDSDYSAEDATQIPERVPHIRLDSMISGD